MSKKSQIEVPHGVKRTAVIVVLLFILLLLSKDWGEKKEPVKEVIPELVSAPVVNNDSSASTLTINETKGVETNGITEFRGIKTTLKF